VVEWDARLPVAQQLALDDAGTCTDHTHRPAGQFGRLWVPKHDGSTPHSELTSSSHSFLHLNDVTFEATNNDAEERDGIFDYF
jgi:hypothetical protein